MADQHAILTAAHPSTERANNPLQRFLSATELDTRLLGMVGALVIIWIGFHIFSGGLFLTPRNLWNLSVQTASVAVMATGMVLVIVTRNIDLSVGSMLGLRRHGHGRDAGRYPAGQLGSASAIRRSGSSSLAGRPCRRRRHRRAAGRHHRLSATCRPSSSRSAACSSGAAPPGGSPAGAPSRRWIRPSS